MGNIHHKMNSLRDIGLFILAGVAVTFITAVTVLTYTINYMGRSTTHSVVEEKVNFAEELFTPDYTDKTQLVEKGAEKDVLGNKQQLKVNLNSLDLAVEDADF